MEKIIQLNKENIDNEHICCAFSDKKCITGYQLKKDWLRKAFENGYIFKRIDARAKVFIEYGPAEKGWIPVDAPNFLLINCLWVSGQYKGQGYAKALLQEAIDDAIMQQKDGLVTIVGATKYHFMSDTKWFIKQGFEICEKLDSGFVLLVKKIKIEAQNPVFKPSVKSGKCENTNGLVAYYSNRCPFTEFHVNTSLRETADKRNIRLTIVKLDTMDAAQAAPTPATIFTLFYNGNFITTDLSVCLDSRFDKVINL